MKFFKCLSRNVSIIQDQEEIVTKQLSHHSKQKKRRSGANEKGAPVPNSHRGLNIRTARKEKSRSCSEKAPLVDDAQTGMENPDQLVPQGIHNTTCKSDLESLVSTSDAQMPARVSLHQTYNVHNPLIQISDEEQDQTYIVHNPICQIPDDEQDQTYIVHNPIGQIKDDEQDQTYNVHNPICQIKDDEQDQTYIINNHICQIPDDELDQTTFKIQKFLSSLPACNEVSLLKYESEESAVSFATIYDTDCSQMIDCSLTPLDRSLPKQSQTDRPRFHNRFPVDCLNNGTLFPRPSSGEVSQSTINDQASPFYDILRLVDHNVTNECLHPVGKDSLCTDLTVQGSPNHSLKDGDMDIDVEGLNSTVTSIGSGYLDPVVAGSHHLFKVTLVRGDNGEFGFMLAGDCPPQVIVVNKDSPADLAGIMPHDIVIRINSKTVHSSSADSVINFLRKLNEPYILMELLRNFKTGVTNNLYDSNSENKSEIGAHDYHQDSTIQQDLIAEAAGVIEASPESYNEMTFQDSGTLDDQKHKVIKQLMWLEVNFIKFMHYGIEKYSRPLRRYILSSHQHTTLFQNIEKLVTISEYHFNEMREENASINQEMEDSQCSSHSLFVYLPAWAYVSKIHLMCQAYQTYIQGFEQSYELLRELRKNKEFSKFMKEVKRNDVSDHSSINAFMRKPVQHIQELYMTVKELLAATPESSPDFNSLHVIKDLMSQCAKPASKLCSPTFRNQNTLSSQNNLSHWNAKRDKINVASCVNIRPSESVKSLNTLRIQDRIVFASYLKDHQQCLNKQHLIYQGNVYRSNKKGSWIKHEFLLFSEMLLLATETSDGSLCVSDSPIHMKDLTGLEINRAHPSEFVLHLHQVLTEKVSLKYRVENHTEGRGSTLVLRATSAQDTFLWKSLLEQRVPAVTGRCLNFVIPSKQF